MKIFKRSKAIGFFDEDFQLQKLTAMGDPLSCLAVEVDFEQFRALLTKEQGRNKALFEMLLN